MEGSIWFYTYHLFLSSFSATLITMFPLGQVTALEEYSLSGQPLKSGVPHMQDGSGGTVLLGRVDTSGVPRFEIGF